ncbi:DoxX family membrane protein [bacterium]|nr:DoxX family membrane protein [bacterium]
MPFTNTQVTNTQELGATLARVSLGGLLLSHGLMKVLVFTVPGTVGYFASLGLPPAAAYLTMFGELVGGGALILGLYTRLASLLTLPLLLGAIWAHSGNGWLFSNQGGGWEFPLYLAAHATIVSLLGSGAYALKSLPVIDRFIPACIKE